MWQLMNLTPFSADRAWIRDRDGAEVWQVAVRASFDVHSDGRCEISTNQTPVRLAPQYAPEPHGALLLHDTDLPLIRRATDVLLAGDAHAPRGRPTTVVDATLRLGPIDKCVRVIGDRYGRHDGSPHQPAPFLTMPITYSRALGGVDPASPDRVNHSSSSANPAGVGFAWNRVTLAERRYPNCEFPHASGMAAAEGAPAGFGPIAPAWASRVRYAGTYDARWEEERAPLLPDDLDERFFQSAPTDQQVDGFLRGGELVELTNLSRSGSLRFALPRVELRAQTRFARESLLMVFALVQVSIDARASRVELTHYARLRCHAKVQELEKTIVRWKPVVRLHALGGRSVNRSPAAA